MCRKKHNLNTSLACFFVLLVVFFLPAKTKAFQKKETGVTVLLEPSDKKGSFRAKKPVKFRIVIKNPMGNDQEGTMVYNVNNENGETVLTNSLDVKVNAKKKLESSFEVEIDQEGTYTLNATFELNDYNETITRNFAYSGPPRKVKDRRNIPNPYDQNWSRDNIDKTEASKKEALVVESEKATVEEEPPADQEEGEIITKMSPSNKDGLYYDNKNIKYSVTLINKYKTKQQGTFKVFIKTDTGELIGEKEVKIKLAKRGIKKFSIVLPAVNEPGVYDVSAAVNLNTYDDTTYHAFGYKINSINTPYHTPPDFEKFWETTRTELNKIDPQYKITLDESRSTYFHTVYKVEINSWDNIPFYGWLTIPKPKGKYPVLIGYGGYKIELSPLYFDDFISFAVNVRGIDIKTEKTYNPEDIPQLFLNIEDHEKYVYRGIYMDCIRAVEFIFAHSNMGMDLNRVITFGGSQGGTLAMVVASMMPDKIRTVVANTPTFFDWARTIEIGKSYKELTFPVKDILEFEIKNKEISIDKMLNTLQYFELQNFVPNIVCPVLLGVSLLDRFVPASTAFAAFNKLPFNTIKKSELYVFPSLGHEVPKSHDAFVATWFLEKIASRNANRY